MVCDDAIVGGGVHSPSIGRRARQRSLRFTKCRRAPWQLHWGSVAPWTLIAGTPQDDRPDWPSDVVGRG
jgi:hypothetical protein